MDAGIRALASELLPKDRCPVLFLYSPADALIPAAAVEAFADRVAAHRPTGGALLARASFDRSGHVKHMHRHADAYAGHVRELLRRAGCADGAAE